jgi:hypothetical protein
MRRERGTQQREEQQPRGGKRQGTPVPGRQQRSQRQPETSQLPESTPGPPHDRRAGPPTMRDYAEPLGQGDAETGTVAGEAPEENNAIEACCSP